MRPLDRAQSFTVVCGGSFPCSTYRILFVEEAVLAPHTRITAEKRYNFWSDRWISLKFLHEFLEAVFLIVRLESLLVEEAVLARHTGIAAEKGHNFWSDRWIVLKVSQ